MPKMRPFGKHRSLRQALAAEPENPDLRLYKRARQVYAQIKQRCTNPRQKRYVDYGGRGIQLKISLEDFSAWYVAEARSWPAETCRALQPSVDRINNDGHYEAGNVQLRTLSANAKKMYQDRQITRPQLSHKNVELKGIRVKVEGIEFPSILAAASHFGRSRYWVLPRMERLDG